MTTQTVRPPSSGTAIRMYKTAQSLAELWPALAAEHGDVLALHDPHAKPEVKLTYRDLATAIHQFAVGLQTLGVNQGDRIALFSDNSPQWFVADQGIMSAGAVDAVRSSQADRDELLYILENSGSIGLIVQDQATLRKLEDALGNFPLKFVMLLSDEVPETDLHPTYGFKLLNLKQLSALGSQAEFKPVSCSRDSLATLIYTSGTSGRPKGVMLSHGNILFQIDGAMQVVTPRIGERVMSLLPSWHSYGRTFEYFVLSQGCTQIYTSIRYVKQDLRTYKPQYMVGVPRIWESIYEGIQKRFREQPEKKQKLVQFFLDNSQTYISARRTFNNLNLDNLTPSVLEKLAAGLTLLVKWPIHVLGDRLVYNQIREATGGEINYLVSGGGSLAKHLDTFFEIIGVNILQGYGLTETSPITNVRKPQRNIRGTSGPPLIQTEIRIVDPETRQPLPFAQKGLILIRGPQVMQGYYRNPEATAKAIDPEGWFDSGDLGWMTPQGDLTITGRAKDTIVLSNGENIEPLPIEDACARSAYVDQIMLVGQDQKMLGALIIPNLDSLQKWAIAQGHRLEVPEGHDDSSAKADGVDLSLPTLSLDSNQVQKLFQQELNREVKNRPGYRPDDRIAVYRLITEPFSIENGLMTQTLKIKRNVVMERYRDMIDAMYAG
ncbi:MAG: AMP-binding protein [Elainellaceae cyanobacterium]